MLGEKRTPKCAPVPVTSLRRMLSTVRRIAEFGGVVAELREIEHFVNEGPPLSLAAVLKTWVVQV